MDLNLDQKQSLLIRKYLEAICEANQGSLESFKDFFKSDFLKSIEERVAIYNSDPSQGLTEDFQGSE
jgi:hypothetical protein